MVAGHTVASRLAAWGLIALLVAVFPANVYRRCIRTVFRISHRLRAWYDCRCRVRCSSRGRIGIRGDQSLNGCRSRRFGQIGFRTPAHIFRIVGSTA